MELFLDIATTLYEAKSFYDIGKIIISILQKLANNQLINGKIGIYDKENDEYKYYYNSDDKAESDYPDKEIYKILNAPCKFSEIKYFSRIVADTKNKLIIQDNHSAESLKIHPIQEKFAAHAMMWMPLVYNNEFLGIISIGSKPVNSFTDEIAENVEGIAKLTSIKVYELFSASNLMKSEERFRGLYENVTIGLYRTTPDGKILLANPALVKMLGYSSFEELSKRNLENERFEPEYSRSEFRQKMEESGEINGIEKVWTKMDGTTIYVRENVRVKLNNDGTILYYEGTIEDISDRKLTEEALKESNDKFMTLANLLPGYIGYVNANTLKYEFINNAYVKSFGIPREKIIGRKVKEIIGEKNYHFALKFIEEAKSGKSVSYENVFNLDIGQRWLKVNYVPDFDKNGNVKSIVVLNYDITEVKQAELALRKSEEKWRRLFEILPVGVSILDVNYKISDMNPALEKILEISKEDSQLKTYQQRKYLRSNNTPMLPDEFPSMITVKEQRVVENIEIGVIKENGATIWTEVSAAPLSLPDAICVIVTTNITERKQMEKSLIENERLSAIGELAYGVAHDFNNSLQIMFGNIELAFLEPDIPKVISEYLNAIKTSAVDAAVRVKQLQRFSGKEKNEDDYISVNLNTLLDETIVQTRSKWKDEAEKNGLNIYIQKNYGKIKSVDGNLGELRIVFYNLIRNAIEAMPDGGKISFATSSIDKDVYVRITDSGIGMDEDSKKRIFQPFYSTKGFERGRGLGMSVVYSIIRDHGGKIYVKESGPDIGTTIELTLPAGMKKPECLSEVTLYRDYKPARVLWVDDEEMIRIFGRAILEKSGHHPEVAESGEEALRILEEKQFDLIITDIGMPNMSGWQLAETIKDKYQGMKVIVVSGWGDYITNEEKEKYGVGYVLKKPVDWKELENIIREVMQLDHK